jgi:hypothetical protein
MIIVKDGVKFSAFRREIYGLWASFEAIFAKYNIPMRITCGTDGHGPNDPHSHACAIDIDTHDIPGQPRELTQIEKYALVTDLCVYAGPTYYIFLENEGLETEHIHCQIRKDLWPAIVKGNDNVANTQS